MIWASFAWGYKGSITFLEGKMDAKKYRNMLAPHFELIQIHFGSEKWIFQQDNAPIHTAKENKAWFSRKEITLLPWPTLSPDLNPIENLWGILARRVYANNKQYERIEELKRAILREWENIELTKIK